MSCTVHVEAAGLNFIETYQRSGAYAVDHPFTPGAEAAGTVDAELLERGAQIVRTASETWRMPAQVVTADPAEHDAWLVAMTEAVGRTL